MSLASRGTDRGMEQVKACDMFALSLPIGELEFTDSHLEYMPKAGDHTGLLCALAMPEAG